MENNIFTHQGNPPLSSFYCDTTGVTGFNSGVVCSIADGVDTLPPGKVKRLCMIKCTDTLTKGLHTLPLPFSKYLTSFHLLFLFLLVYSYCSNRGLCDFTAGVCSCFADFTNANCDSYFYGISAVTSAFNADILSVQTTNSSFTGNVLRLSTLGLGTSNFNFIKVTDSTRTIFTLDGAGNVNMFYGHLVISGGNGYGGLTIASGGLTVTGGVTVYTAGIQITGGVSVSSGGVMVYSNGVFVTGGVSINTGGLTVTNGVTINTGGLLINSGGMYVNNNGMTINSGGLNVQSAGIYVYSGGLTVTAGLTIRTGGLYVNNAGVTIASGGLAVSGGVSVQTLGIKVTGGLSIYAGGLYTASGITIASGGAQVTGGLTVYTGGISLTGGLSIYSGGLIVSTHCNSTVVRCIDTVISFKGILP